MDNILESQYESGMTVVLYALNDTERAMLNEMVENGEAKDINDAIKKKVHDTFMASSSATKTG